MPAIGDDESGRSAHGGDRAGDDQGGDDALVAAGRAGDRRAIAALLDRYQRRVFGFGLRMCGDREDAEDVLQDTLLAAARTLSGFRGDASVSSWLFTIARSYCIKKRRRGKFEPAGHVALDDQADRLVAPHPRPDEELDGRETKEAVGRALEELEPAAREVLILRDIEGLTAPEVAAITGESIAAIKSRLHRARALMRTYLERALSDGPLEPAPAPRPGSTCPDVLAGYSRKMEGELSASICTQMEAHLAGCPHCTALCDSLKSSLALCRRAGADDDTVPPKVAEKVRAAVRAALAEVASTS